MPALPTGGFVRHAVLAAMLALGLGGCATMPVPANHPDAQYQPEQALVQGNGAASCRIPARPPELATLHEVPAADFVDAPALLAAGDRLVLQISGDKDLLSTTYVVAADGNVAIAPDLVIAAAGKDRRAFEADLRRALVSGGYVRDIANNVRVLQVITSAVMVSVEGAVFQPGVQAVGGRLNEQNTALVDHPAQGDFNDSRTLTRAVELSGGLRPDAWPETLYVVRGDRFAVLDVRPALVGGVGQADLPTNMQMAKGDRVIVPSSGCFDARLVRPSPVTAPGIRVYMSNLSRSAASNASAAIGHDSTSLPYGTRLLQGLVSANCVGGSALNARRSAVLISRNPINGHAVVIARSIEGLVREADRDAIDPYLMPGDAIACYDSGAMNVADVVGLMGQLLGPAVLIKGLNL